MTGMKKVKSSNLAEVGYDPATKELRVQFAGGGLYRYQDVPQAKYDALMSADSPGKYLHSNIKSHKWEKVS